MLAVDYVRLPDVVQQGGLSVIDMAHDGDNRWARDQRRRVVVVDLLRPDSRTGPFRRVGLNHFDRDAKMITQKLKSIVRDRSTRPHHFAHLDERLDDLGCRLIDHLCKALGGYAGCNRYGLGSVDLG